MNEPTDSSIELRITGARAQRGVSLSDFESFIENFLRALRDYDRVCRNVPTKQTGHPDGRAEAVSAFRLIGFRTGSGIAQLEPERVLSEDQLPIDDVPRSLATLTALSADMEAGRTLPPVVIESLTKACRSAGPDGAVAIRLPGARTAVSFSETRLAQLSPSRTDEQAEVRSIAGRLHLIDVEPGRVGIRSATGIEWLCKYPEELETHVMSLVGQAVWAEGSGALTSPLRGMMTVTRVIPLESEQGSLFTHISVSDAELADAQGIRVPQGLDSLVDPDWDDSSDDAYLAALLGK